MPHKVALSVKDAVPNVIKTTTTTTAVESAKLITIYYNNNSCGTATMSANIAHFKFHARRPS